MRRRRIAVVGAAVLVVAAGASLLPAVLGDDPADAQDRADSGAAGPARSTVAVERRDLVERKELDGTLGYGEARDLAFRGQGTITALTEPGTVVDRGGRLGEVNGRPVTLLFGDRPMWRTLGEGADTSDGPDIAQLEANLIAMGYGTEAGLGPNERWSQATTRAVKAWQEALGVEATGRVDVGDVVFAPGPLRIADHVAEVGSTAGGPALRVSATERFVHVDLDAGDRDLLAAGQAVEVELPDGTVVPATVRSVGATVTPGDPLQGSGDTVAVEVVLDDPASAGDLESAPVEVRIVSVQAEGALAVPVQALLALSEGGYAVERPDGTLVGVELTAFADGWVGVVPTTGELAEGDEVVVPA